MSVDQENKPIENIPQAEPAVEQTKVESQVEEPESVQQVNWRQFREQKEKLRKDKEEANRRMQEEAERAKALQEALAAALNKPTPQEHQYDETEEQRIARLVREEIEKEKQQWLQEQKQEEIRSLPYRIKETMPDYYNVVTNDHCDYLEYHHPELARALSSQPESLQKNADIYAAIKRYVPNLNSQKDQKKADMNLNKPQAFSSTVTPDAKIAPLNLTEERRRQNWERMQKVLKGLT